MPLICAFHANVDRSEAITIRQRYTQDFPTTLSAHECHLDITFFYGSINPSLKNILYVVFFVLIRHLSLEGYVGEAAPLCPLLLILA